MNASLKTIKKNTQRLLNEVTGIGHKRGFKVKWSDGIQTEERQSNAWFCEGNEGGKKRKGRDGFKPDAIECEDDANNDEESEEEEKKGR